MSDAARKPFPWKAYIIWTVLIVIFMVLPLISVTLTYLIADAADCVVNEATINPCVVMGADIGGLLYGMGVAGWLFFLTIFYGLMALATLAVVCIIHYVVHRRAVAKTLP